MACPTPTRVQFPAWLLQIQTPSRGGGCRGEELPQSRGCIFLEETGHPANQMYTLEHKASSASHYH